MVADALRVDLNKATKRLFVDLSSTSLDYNVNLSNRSNPVVEISDKAVLPIGKDYLIVDNETVLVPGLTVYAPKTGKVYVSQRAVEILLTA
jgi:alkaline phosphatase